MLAETQKRDAYKNKWCKENNYPLKRIPFWDKDKITLEYLLDGYEKDEDYFDIKTPT